MLRYFDFQLRKMAETDLDLVLQWRNSESIARYMYCDHTITMAEHRAWFNRAAAEQKHIPYIFVYQSKPIGYMNISDIDRPNNKCSWGFYLVDEKLPRGCGSALGYFGLQEIFEKNNFRKLTGEVFAFNNDSLKFHRRLGFCEEGRLIRHVSKNGEYRDLVVLALFKEDWMKNKTDLAEQIFSEEVVPCMK